MELNWYDNTLNILSPKCFVRSDQKITCSWCIALPAASLVLKFTKAQNFSGNGLTLVTWPNLGKFIHQINIARTKQKNYLYNNSVELTIYFQNVASYWKKRSSLSNKFQIFPEYVFSPSNASSTNLWVEKV